ncbi:AMP-binding protein [Ferruginivarius sediminum]|nr:AMP-binding protein [Ferruginivarius sediminum]
MNTDLPFRAAEFNSLTEALDYATKGETGINFYTSRGRLEHVVPYAKLRERARELARRLLGLGLSRGDRVAIVADMHPDFVISFFACQYAGLLAVPLPVPTSLGGRQGYEEQLSRVMKTSGARVALGPEALLNQLRRAADGLEMTLIASTPELAGMPPAAQALQPLGPDEESHVQYSSGSTRHPLGILIDQKALMANAASVARHGLEIRPGDRAASWLPFYHDMGLIGFMIIPITAQVTIDYIQTDGFARRPLQWLQIISDNRCSLSFSPTFGYELCARRAASAKEVDLDLSCWRVAGIGGEMVRAETLADFATTFAPYGFKPGALVPSYGLAESTLAFSFAPLGLGVTVDRVDKETLVATGVAEPANGVRNGNGHTGNGHSSGNGHSNGNGGANGHHRHAREIRAFATCGQPLPGHEVEVRDDDGNALPERHVGRICIKGPSLMSGYYRAPEATKSAMADGEWLDTGDMGYLTRGTLVITGRRKDLVIVNGRNIWPQDLEWHAEQKVDELRSRDTAAFSVEGPDGKEVPVILVQCRSQGAETRERLRSEVHSAIFRNAGIDCRVILIPPRSLPFTTSGKLSRAKAKQAYLAGAFEEEDAGRGVVANGAESREQDVKASY